MTLDTDALTAIIGARIQRAINYTTNDPANEYWLGQLHAYREVATLIDQLNNLNEDT